MERQDKNRTEQRNRKLKWSRVIIAFSLIIVVLGSFTLAIAHTKIVKNTLQKASKGITQQVGQMIAGNNKPMNILLIANNARQAANPLSLGTAGGQADILIVAHIDPQKKKVTLISIPRDTLIALPKWNVPIPKIKTTFTLGLEQSPKKGPELAMKEVSQMTGLSIDHYIVTDFQGFIDAINAIGGIKVDIKARLYDPQHSQVNLQPGVQTLDGEQALAFIRVRQNQAGNSYRTNDFQRQQTEVDILHNLKQQVLGSATNPQKIQKLLKIWQKDIVTNFSTSQLIGLGMEADGFSINQIQLGSNNYSMDLAGVQDAGINKENYITNAYYDILNPKDITRMLTPYGSTGSHLGLPPFPSPQDIPVLVYGSQVVYQQLKQAGFQVTYGGTNNPYSRPYVYYPSNGISLGWVVGRALGDGNEYVAPENTSGNQVIVYAQ